MATGPLRRVVGIHNVELTQYGRPLVIPRVLLECGHHLAVKEDRAPVRRRCWKCERLHPVEIEGDH